METQIIRGGFMVPIDTHLGKWQIEEQKLDHDNFLPPLVCSHLKDGQCIIDCGAFNGDHSIAYSRAVGKNGMVIAVEPGSLAYECLKHNVPLFPFKNTFALQSAVSEECGESVSHFTNENLGGSTCQVVDNKKRKEGEKYLLTVTIDYLAHQAERKIDFIKMDIEGFEAKALLGAIHTLKKDKPGLLIEVNSGALMLQGDTQEDIFAILDYHSYRWEIAQPDCKLSDPQFDLLCFYEPDDK